MPARSSPKPTKTGRVKRSEEARKRRRAKERDRQRRGNEECAKLDRQLGDLERVNGWHGPTRIVSVGHPGRPPDQDSTISPRGPRWVKLPREQQAGFEWAAVEKAVEKSAERVRPPLLRALSRVFLEGNCEDDSIIDEIDFGVNIGIPGHPISLFERDTFRNYESARALPGEVKRELERSVERGHMVKLAEGEPDRNCGPAGIAIGSSRWTPKMPLGTSAWRGRMLSFCLWQSNETDVRGETNRTRRGRSSTTTTMIKRAILSLLCVLYVDDGSWASCDATCLKDFLAVIVLSKVMEVLLELAKARVSNSPRTLGFQWDLHTGKLSVPDEKLELIGGQGDYVLRKAGAGQAVELNVVESLLGRLTWATQCFTRYRCHLAPIFAWLKAVKSKRNAVSQAPLRSAFLGSNVCDKIRLLLGLLRSEQVRAFSLPEIIGRSVEAEWAASGSTIITDASLEGLGGTVCSVSKGRTLRLWFALNLRQSGDMALRQLMGDTFVSGDISRLELLAIVLGLLIVGEIQDESGGECTILSDNTAAIHVVNKGSSSVPRMAELWARLVACRRVGRQVRAFHVPGVSNEISDGLSRGVRPRQRVARALGRRVPVSKFIERLLGASVGELPAYFTVSEEEELLGG